MLEPDEIIYLDNNATTQIDPAVLDEMRPFLEKYYGNPSSGHRFGAQVREAVEFARERVAALIGCTPGEIVFTSGGTEAINTAMTSALQLDTARQQIVTTAVEHSATHRHCEHLVQRGYEVTYVSVDGNGNLDLEELENAITPQTAVVSAMHANNETGVLFPVGKIAEITRRKRVLFHADAVQAAGKIPIQVESLGVNFLSISAHKFHGPKGVGALYVSGRTAFRSSQFGGGQESGRRSGTENVASIVGLGKAAELAAEELARSDKRVREMRDRFERTLLACVVEMSVNGAAAPRLANTSSVAFAGIESDAAVIMLDQQGVCCSAGSACHTGATEPSHVLKAMQLREERLRGCLRFSFGRFNTEADVDRACTSVSRVIARLRSLSAPAVVS
jgi:cysteine desulfurase